MRAARLYATARGVYQMWINGRPVGDQHLAPGWTDYNQRLQVQTYDVTDLLRAGPNAIGAAPADGWFRGKVGMGWRAACGEQLALKAKLRVTYADGSTEDFGTSAQWRSAPGPYVQADLQDGEHYDAGRLPCTGVVELHQDLVRRLLEQLAGSRERGRTAAAIHEIRVCAGNCRGPGESPSTVRTRHGFIMTREAAGRTFMRMHTHDETGLDDRSGDRSTGVGPRD